MARTKTRREEWEARQEQSKRNDFSPLVRAHIRERDGERCVLCSKPGREVHHILPRVQGGLGTVDNGVCLDHECHVKAHRSQKVEKQLMRYRERVLLPYYGLSHSHEFIWLDPLPAGSAVVVGPSQRGKCGRGCGMVVGKIETDAGARSDRCFSGGEDTGEK